MQINNNGITNNTNANTKQKSVADDTPEKPDHGNSSPSVSQDSVVLSSEAQALKELETKIVASSDIDQAKVDRIKQAIADGSYTVNANSTAEKMLSLDN